jgi:SAM-dependent methyltransferase
MAGVTSPSEASEASVAAANAEQSAAWNGHEGEQWVRHADAYDRAARAHWERLLDAGLVGAGDHVVDIGCGTGKSTRDVARITRQGWVVGIDLSAPMLALARQRTAADGLTNVSYVRGDAQVHRFAEDAFEVAISCFGAMFFGDPIAAFTNVGRGMAPGSTLGLLVWRELAANEWLTEMRAALARGRELPLPPPDAPTPFALAEPDRVQTILSSSGFDRVELQPVDEPIVFGADLDEAFAFVQTLGIVGGLSLGLDDEDRAAALADLRRRMAAHCGADGVRFGSAAWLVTARRRPTARV